MAKPGTGRTGHMPVPAPAPRPWELRSPRRIRSGALRGEAEAACPRLLHAGVPTPSGCCRRRSLAPLSLTQRGPSRGSQPGTGAALPRSPAPAPLRPGCPWPWLCSCLLRRGGSVAPLLAPQAEGQGDRCQPCALGQPGVPYRPGAGGSGVRASPGLAICPPDGEQPTVAACRGGARLCACLS